MQMKLASEDGLLGLFHLKSSGGGRLEKITQKLITNSLKTC